jgi:hypothetical protein
MGAVIPTARPSGCLPANHTQFLERHQRKDRGYKRAVTCSEIMTKTVFPSLFTALLLIGTLDAQTAKQDMKDAGQDVKQSAKSAGNAAKKSGSAAKKSSKKAVHKSAKKVKQGAAKVEDKTK